MTLTLYFHPLASYCHKVLVGLYENDIPFAPEVIDLFDPTQRAELERTWPLVKFPVLRDEARGAVVPESSVILEYLDLHHPGPTRFVPADPDGALRCRLLDRFRDLLAHLSLKQRTVRIFAFVSENKIKSDADVYKHENHKGDANANRHFAALLWNFGCRWEYNLAGIAAHSGMNLPRHREFPLQLLVRH